MIASLKAWMALWHRIRRSPVRCLQAWQAEHIRFKVLTLYLGYFIGLYVGLATLVLVIQNQTAQLSGIVLLVMLTVPLIIIAGITASGTFAIGQSYTAWSLIIFGHCGPILFGGLLLAMSIWSQQPLIAIALSLGCIGWTISRLVAIALLFSESRSITGIRWIVIGLTVILAIWAAFMSPILIVLGTVFGLVDGLCVVGRWILSQVFVHPQPQQFPAWVHHELIILPPLGVNLMTSASPVALSTLYQAKPAFRFWIDRAFRRMPLEDQRTLAWKLSLIPAARSLLWKHARRDQEVLAAAYLHSAIKPDVFAVRLNQVYPLLHNLSLSRPYLVQTADLAYRVFNAKTPISAIQALQSMELPSGWAKLLMALQQSDTSLLECTAPSLEHVWPQRALIIAHCHAERLILLHPSEEKWNI